MDMIFKLVYYGYNGHCKLQRKQHERPMTAMEWYDKESRQLPDVLCLGLVHSTCLRKCRLRTTKDRGQRFRYTQMNMLK